MKLKTSFELFRWTHYFLTWFIGMGLCITIIELAAGPALQWLFYDIPYQLPTWDRVGRLTVFVVVSSLLIGTLIWFYEKKRSGR
ncbi:hypothetical protein [Burkholderia diffusa]|uniref:hypothetical protein n=1 Tax=Burkholderia diffusa TaxID=488732 RepID=UPI00076D69AA|nr:hypothetical protein [Burkholderia diffusa]KVM98997.1 hypothetical protein WJ62_17690 [Burkholderia diffusa]